ncbi:hypothetical protein [Streptomyces clavuligerus]|nr:hypothetical protein [Streptomyces clavuligerus]
MAGLVEIAVLVLAYPGEQAGDRRAPGALRILGTVGPRAPARSPAVGSW